jgi:alanine-synthesizing transaminase
MFSHRVPSDYTANRFSTALEARRARGAAIFDLTESNPTRCGFLHDEPALLAALASPAALRYEPHAQGLMSARTAVAGYYAEIGAGVDPESLFLTTGTSEAYTQVFKLLADPGDEILVPTPGYPLLDVLTGLEAVRLVPYVLDYGTKGWTIDRERLRASISTRTRAIVVVSPNNPTGSFLKSHELDDLNLICRDFDLALIVDEVFSDYGRGADSQRVRTAVRNDAVLTFTLNGFSKLAGLPQMKLGWIHASGPAELVRQARERLAYITDAYLSVSAAVQHAAPAILRERVGVQQQINRRLEDNGRELLDCLSPLRSCQVLSREGGWYAVVKIAADASDEELVINLLERDGVLVHPGYFYDFPAGTFLVLSLLPDGETFRRGVSSLARHLRELTRPASPVPRRAVPQGPGRQQ